MVKKISVFQYRKIKNLDFEFSNKINIISGTNGTCKTSLLHIISNSFQAPTKNCDWIDDGSCLDTIKKINSITNPKIESLSRGDKTYNDPANGHKGILFNVEYYHRDPLSFRKHTSKITNRYAVKPRYKPGTSDSLPFCPIIYLGLSRLVPFGEYQNDEAVEGLKKTLPIEYQDEIASVYEKFTGIKISSMVPQKMGDIKTRTDFSSNDSGIDSNTISAGEDNLFILITAIVSLKYYFKSIQSNRDIESILLIDEFDATLHPSVQIQLMQLLKQYSSEFKIQVIFTTHSLYLLEHALKEKENVLYLIDNITSVLKMDSPDIYKIKMFLHGKTHDDIYISRAIPIFTEDNEARIFLNIILDYFAENRLNFTKVRRYFHFVNANIGATNLINIFSDTYLLKSTMQSICVLDGDQRPDYNKYLITLPGNASPENLIMDYSVMLFDNDDAFWIDETILNLNFGKVYYRDNIRPDIDNIANTLRDLENAGKSTRGVKRDLSKKAFIKHERFFELLFKHWVNNPENVGAINKFYKDLNIMFKKVAEFHEINSNEWNYA
jgi:predicted ATPase